MNYHIRKLTPSKRPINSRNNQRQMSKSKEFEQFSSLSPTKSQDPDQRPLRLTTKLSLQTIMWSKTNYVEKLNLSSTTWCVYDAKKSRYIGFRQKTQRQIASITKIMTTIIAIQFFEFHNIPKDVLIRVTQSSAKLIGTSAQLKYNTWIHVWDLLYGSMLPSGNDAANLLAEYVGYFLKNKNQNPAENPYIDLLAQNTNILIVQFIKLMNNKAQELGLMYTTFSNPHGLQNAMNRSTAKDILILSQYASNNQTFRKVMNTDTYRYSYYEEPKDLAGNIIACDNICQKYKKHRKRWWNTNILLSKGWQGLKTGQTIAAGSCLSSLKNDVYIVVLNCKDNQARFSETQKIYQWYCQNHRNISTADTDSEAL